MKISMYLYTTELGCELEINNSLCKTILNGALYAENDVFGEVETGNLEMLYTVIYTKTALQSKHWAFSARLPWFFTMRLEILPYTS